MESQNLKYGSPKRNKKKSFLLEVKKIVNKIYCFLKQELPEFKIGTTGSTGVEIESTTSTGILTESTAIED